MIRTEERKHRFGRHDRIVIKGAFYRCEKKVRDSHLLQLVVDGVLQETWISRTDKQVNALIRAKHFRCDQDHYSRAATLLRMRGGDDSDIYDLEDDELRTVAWKTEWVDRFRAAHVDVEARWRPTRSLGDMADWVEENKDALDRWYLQRFEERRRPGRRKKGEERKAFDWPGASTLREWLIKYEDENCRMEAFRPRYHLCGNRDQLDPRATEIIAQCVRRYAGSNAPLKKDIVEHVDALLHLENKSLPEDDQISVSDKAIRLRIGKLNPLLVDLGRKGVTKAIQIHAPVGKGQRLYRVLERIEMDDWEFDLFALVKRSSVWKDMSPKMRKLVPRVRCTVTVAIDVATRCVVGLFISPVAPSTAGSRTALRSALIDKTRWAAECECTNGWPMHGGLGAVVTDGGPAFQGEFDDAVRFAAGGRRRPNQDKTMRGYVERFFLTLRTVCTYFAGRTFANVVEKGDYDAEAHASMVFDDLRKAVVRFIVDQYHHRPHRGLEGKSPYQKWMEFNDNGGIPLAPSDQAIRLAFSFPHDYVIDQHGVTVGRFSYNDERLSALRAVMKGTKVSVRLDPFDLGTATVSVPARYRQRFVDHAKAMKVPLLEGQDKYLDVRCVDRYADGLMLDAVMAADARVKAFVREAAEEGKDARYAAVLDLIETGEKARRTAGLPTFVPTQKEFEAVVGLWHQKGRQALLVVKHATETVDPDEVGEVVGVSKRTKPRKKPAGGHASGATPGRPFGGSLNMAEEDEE